MNDFDTETEQEYPADPAADAWAELSRHLTDIATVLFSPGAAGTTAERILALARAAMDGCDEGGLCGVGALAAHVSPSPLMVQLDDVQSALGQGPCAEALAGLDAIYVPDLLEDDRRWPRFSPEAARLGVRSALAYRLSVGHETVGALQLYARLPGAFNATDRAQGLVLATYAALAIAIDQARQAESRRIENLEAALSSREIIGQAQGILMARERITADQAFDLLRRSSQHLNRKLRAIAQDVVDTGTIPRGPDAD